MKDFVFRSVNFETKSSLFKLDSFALIIVSLAALCYFCEGNSNFVYLPMVIISLSIISAIIVVALTAIHLTTKKYFIAQSISSFSWIIVIIFIEMVILEKHFTINFNITPFIVLPFLSAFTMYGYLTKKKGVCKRNSIINGINLVGLGIICYYLGRFIYKDIIRHINPHTNAMIILIGLLFLSCLFSIGLVNIARLYYLNVLQRQDIDLSEYIVK